MKIILSGGGTLGPVVPLIAIAEVCRAESPDTSFLWLGTKNGPEREVVEKNNIAFIAIGSGKWRRYFSLLNIFDIFRVVAAFFQSFIILSREKPDLLITAGGYVSVPLHFAAALLGLPTWVHQQDARIGLANRLMMKTATKITTALRDTVASLPMKKTEWIGNPVRNLQMSSLKEAYELFDIPEGSTVIFALGGGTGSASVNNLILEALPHWPKEWHVVHLVGKYRPQERAMRTAGVYPNYHAYEFFIDEMKAAYAIATVVVARAGFGTLTELAALKKPAIILPIFGSHQEDNASVLYKHNAILLLDRTTAHGLKLAQLVKELVDDGPERKALGENLHKILPAAEEKKILEIVHSLVVKE